MARVYVDRRSIEELELGSMHRTYEKKLEEDRESWAMRGYNFMPDLFTLPTWLEWLRLYRIFRQMATSFGSYRGDQV